MLKRLEKDALVVADRHEEMVNAPAAVDRTRTRTSRAVESDMTCTPLALYEKEASSDGGLCKAEVVSLIL